MTFPSSSNENPSSIYPKRSVRNLIKIAIHKTSPINAVQSLHDPLPPKEVLRSTCRSPSIVTICLICHKGWRGSRRYAAETSDLNMTRAVFGWARWYWRRAVVKSAIESILAPTMTSHAIIELSEKGPALWSFTSLNLMDQGFGTTWIGVLYIPGNNSFPKLSEYRPAAISMSLCDLRNSASASFFRGRSEKSHVTGYSSLWVWAQGQKPSLSEVQTDSTKGLLGCVSSNFSNRSTLTGVTIWKRWGCWLIVVTAQILAEGVLVTVHPSECTAR